jgi:glutamine amidotransferase
MCRHLAYVGPPVPLRALLLDPPSNLVRQSWAPRRQTRVRLNADGFGVGWYPLDEAGGSGPIRYRRSVPAWTDRNLVELARTVRSTAVLAAVRSATTGFPVDESCCAPFRAGRWLFSHNGRLFDWPGCVDRMAAASGLTPSSLAREPALIDSTLLWALVRDRLEAGEDAVSAVARVTADAFAGGAGGRVNLLLHEGSRIVATAAGDTLCYRAGTDDVVVASEPHDDEAGWVDVPDGSVLVATPDGVAVHSLPAHHPRDGARRL